MEGVTPFPRRVLGQQVGSRMGNYPGRGLRLHVFIVFDLLVERPPSDPEETKQGARGKGVHGSREVVLAGLKFKAVESLAEMMSVFAVGNERHAVGGTGMNDVSSRSHAVVRKIELHTLAGRT